MPATPKRPARRRPDARSRLIAAAVIASLLAAFAVYFDWRTIRLAPAGPEAGIWAGARSVELTRTFNFFAWLIGIVVVTVLLGQHVALPAFIALYLLVWGGYSWKLALGYAAAGLGLMIMLFDYLSPTLWYPALLLRWW